MTDQPDSLIRVRGLMKTFGLRPVLRDVSFDVARANVAVLLGANGSGKTTLLRLLSGLSKPSVGTISSGGWTLPGEAANVRAQIGVVAHLPLLYDDLSAEENLQFFGRLYEIPQPMERIKFVLDRVGLAKRARELVRTFSRGMMQRLAIGRAMLHDPAVLLLDEPYTGLDVSGAEMLDRLFGEWKAAGRTVIVSLHDLDRAAGIGDQVLILGGGRLVANGTTAEIGDLTGLFAQVTA
jgi:heme exporter protein A